MGPASVVAVHEHAGHGAPVVGHPGPAVSHVGPHAAVVPAATGDRVLLSSGIDIVFRFHVIISNTCSCRARGPRASPRPQPASLRPGLETGARNVGIISILDNYIFCILVVLWLSIKCSELIIVH